MAKKPTFEKLPEAVAQLLEEVAEIKKILKANGIPSKNNATLSLSETKPQCEEIDVDQVCEMLKRTKQTVYAIVRSGALKPRKQGRKLLFPLKEVEKYANSSKKKPRKRKVKKTPVAEASAEIKPADTNNNNESVSKPVESGRKRGWPLGRRRR